MEEKKIGRVLNYFAKVGVAALEITEGELRVGDTIHVKGATTDFTQTVDSMQIEHQSVEKASAGESVGLKVKDRVRQDDEVFVVQE